MYVVAPCEKCTNYDLCLEICWQQTIRFLFTFFECSRKIHQMFSSDPFQRLTAGGTFNRTSKIFLQRYDLFLTITGIVFVPLALLMMTIFQFFGSSFHTIMNALNSQQNITEYDGLDDALYGTASSIEVGDEIAIDPFVGEMSKFLSQLVVEYLIFAFLAIAAKAAMTHAVAELYAGRDPKWLECLKQGFSRWCDVFGAILLVNTGVFCIDFTVRITSALLVSTQSTFLAFLSFLVSMVWFVSLMFITVSLMVLAPVIMVEGTGPIRSLKRCREISWNNRCYIFCSVFSFCMLYYVVQIILCVLLASLGGVDAVMSTWGAFVMTLPAMIYIPIQSM